MSAQIDKNAQSAMQKALEAYKKDKSSVKEFYPCAQRVSKWLNEKGK